MHSQAMCLPREEASKSKDFQRVLLNSEVCLHKYRPNFLFLVCIHPSDSHAHESEAPFLASATGSHLVNTSCGESVQLFLSRFRHLCCAFKKLTSFDISQAPTISRHLSKRSSSYTNRTDPAPQSGDRTDPAPQSGTTPHPAIPALQKMPSTKAQQHSCAFSDAAFTCFCATSKLLSMISKTSALDALGQRNRLCRNTKKASSQPLLLQLLPQS